MSEKLSAGHYRATFILTKNQNMLATIHTVVVDVYLSSVPTSLSKKTAIGEILYLMEWPKKYAENLVSLERIDQ